MELTSLQRGSLVELATRQLHGQIVAGDWGVGARIPAETELATRLGVGRSTVREAVRALAHAGLLETRQGSGTFVRAQTGSGGWEALVRKAATLEVYEVRGGLEFQAARLAAMRRTDDDLEHLDATLLERNRAWRNARDVVFVEADLAFHRAVVIAAHNDLLLNLYDDFASVLRDVLLAFVTHDPLPRELSSEIQDAHVDLAAAIRAANPITAIAATGANLDVTAAALGGVAPDSLSAPGD